MALPAPRRRMTPEEYLEWEDEQELRHEFWDGEVYPKGDLYGVEAMAGGNARHATIMANLPLALMPRLRARGCRPFSSDMRVRIPDLPHVYPDFSVVCGPPTFTTDTETTLLNPTLVVEVLSRSTEAFDRGGKAQAYRSLPSVQALVLVAQDRPAVEVHRREADGRWTLEDAIGLDAAVDLLGERVALSDLYEGIEFDPAPPGPLG